MRNEFNTANGGENKSGVAGSQAANSFAYQKKRFNCKDSKGVYCVEGAVHNRLQKAHKAA